MEKCLKRHLQQTVKKCLPLGSKTGKWCGEGFLPWAVHIFILFDCVYKAQEF